jgi:hypothetical protein
VITVTTLSAASPRVADVALVCFSSGTEALDDLAAGVKAGPRRHVTTTLGEGHEQS